MYKVFINDREIILTDNYDDYRSEYDTVFISFGSEEALFDLVDLLKKSPVLKRIVVIHDNLEELWSVFTDKYDSIAAAGGVIQNGDRILFIFKNKHWDLPKGKIEGSDSLEDTAIREVKEECGLKEVELVNPMETTYYLYNEGEKTILKKTDWFLMKTSEEGPFKGDEKEGISEVKWMDASSWAKEVSKTYPSVQMLTDSVFGS